MKVTAILVVLLGMTCFTHAQVINKDKYIIDYTPITVFIADSIVRCRVVDLPKKSFKSNKTYYWYHKNEIHHNQGSAAGRILHGNVQAFDEENNLITEGEFHFGLKDEIWNYWDKEGVLLRKERWKRGTLLKETVYERGETLGVDNHRKNLIRAIF